MQMMQSKSRMVTLLPFVAALLTHRTNTEYLLLNRPDFTANEPSSTALKIKAISGSNSAGLADALARMDAADRHCCPVGYILAVRERSKRSMRSRVKVKGCAVMAGSCCKVWRRVASHRPAVTLRTLDNLEVGRIGSSRNSSRSIQSLNRTLALSFRCIVVWARSCKCDSISLDHLIRRGELTRKIPAETWFAFDTLPWLLCASVARSSRP